MAFSPFFLPSLWVSLHVSPFIGVKLACNPVTIWLMTQCHYKNHFRSFIGPTSRTHLCGALRFVQSRRRKYTLFLASWNLSKSGNSTRVKLAGVFAQIICECDISKGKGNEKEKTNGNHESQFRKPLDKRRILMIPTYSFSC